MRPWDDVRIEDDKEPLESLESPLISFEAPHPYVSLGAPYSGASPWVLRRSVKTRLLDAQRRLGERRPGWRLHLLDAWRPLAVQRFMVEYTDALIRRAEPHLDDAMRRERVLSYWAPPSENPATPPPHSTGAAVDLTLVDAHARPGNMGSPFDEPTGRSHPDHFAHATDANGREAHAHRRLLLEVMHAAGFVQQPNEWWHFSYGDRSWARANGLTVARYGRTEPITTSESAASSPR
jgi:D-alanyl-D-alanine dipeptidase